MGYDKGKWSTLNLDENPELKEVYTQYLDENPCLKVKIEKEGDIFQIKDSEDKIMETLPHDKPVCVENPNEIEIGQFLGAALNMTDKNVWIRVRKLEVGTQEPKTLDKVDEKDLNAIIRNRSEFPGTIKSYYQKRIGGEEVDEEMWLGKHAKNATIVYEVVPESLQKISNLNLKNLEENFKRLKKNSYEYVIIEEVSTEEEKTEEVKTEQPTEGGRKQTKHKKKS